MPSSIIVPTLDSQYDLAGLSPLQAGLLPFEPWWELCLWTLFVALLVWKVYQYLLSPYLT